jgi:hypothetical protein
MSNMKDRLLKLTKWSLQLRQRPSDRCLNSHHNMSIYLIIQEF